MFSTTQDISCHIWDFKFTPQGEVKLLEWGNAFYNSNFSGYETSNNKNIREMMLSYLKTSFSLQDCYPPLQSEIHWNVRKRQLDENDDTTPIEQENSTLEKLNIVPLETLKDDYHFQHIQDLWALYCSDTKKMSPVLDGTVDSFFVCDRDKKFSQTLLKMAQLENHQPKTWHWSPNHTDLPSVSELSKNKIDHVVIKSTNDSLRQGMLVIPIGDLEAVLNAIKNRDPNLAPKYKEDLNYYSQSNQHQYIIIQELIRGNKIKEHEATGRVIFSIERRNNKPRVHIVDVFWHLAPSPTASEQPSKQEIVSITSKQVPKNSTFNFFVPIEGEERKKLCETLTSTIEDVATAVYRLDVKTYILNLYKNKKIEDISYYLKFYSHIRINNLDEELIAAFLSAVPELAKTFLITQAKKYALARHLVCPQKALASWLINNLSMFDHTQNMLEDLKKFLDEEMLKVGTLSEETKQNDEKYLTFIKPCVAKVQTALLPKTMLTSYNAQQQQKENEVIQNNASDTSENKFKVSYEA